MKVPSVFYGTYKKVKAETSKVYTQIKRGKSLEEIFARFELLDINDYPVDYASKWDGEVMVPSNLVWLDRSWSMSGGREHFVLCPFVDPLTAYPFRFSYEEADEIKLKLIPFLSQTEWGCIILNGVQSYAWTESKNIIEPIEELVPAPPEIVAQAQAYLPTNDGIPMWRPPSWKRPIDPDIALLILEPTIKYWDNFLLYGKRFYIGGAEAIPIYGTRLLSYYIIARLGFDSHEFPCETVINDYPVILGNIKRICEKYSIIDKLKCDESFRNKAREGTLVQQEDN
jgi:hypothetical protein